MKKIQDETKLLYGYTEEYAPKFISSRTDFKVILMNLNSAPQDNEVTNVLDFCTVEKSANEIMNFCGLKDKNHFRKTVLNPLLGQGSLFRTLPDKPTSKNQKYVTKKSRKVDALSED